MGVRRGGQGDTGTGELLHAAAARAERGIWVGYLLAGAVVCAIYLALPELTSALVYEAVGLSAVVAVIVAVRIYEVERPAPWYLIAAGLALLTIGDSIFNANDIIFDNPPFPSIADAAYLSAYPFLC